eukprot:362227-Chlamydomonas_euryale.AAC.4
MKLPPKFQPPQHNLAFCDCRLLLANIQCGHANAACANTAVSCALCVRLQTAGQGLVCRPDLYGGLCVGVCVQIELEHATCDVCWAAHNGARRECCATAPC